MQAIQVSQLGGPEVMAVGEVPVPQPGPDEVLVRVLAAGVGPWDAHLRSGGWTGSLPYIPGGEVARLVEGDTRAHPRPSHGAPGYRYPGPTGLFPPYGAGHAGPPAPIPARPPTPR